MELKKGQEQYYNDYKESTKDNVKAKQAFEIANTYADKVETLIKENNKLKLNTAFAMAEESMPHLESVSGYIKSSAFTMLTKTWIYGKDFDSYTVRKEDNFAKMMR